MFPSHGWCHITSGVSYHISSVISADGRAKSHGWCGLITLAVSSHNITGVITLPQVCRITSAVSYRHITAVISPHPCHLTTSAVSHSYTTYVTPSHHQCNPTTSPLSYHIASVTPSHQSSLSLSTHRLHVQPCHLGGSKRPHYLTWN